jgi:DNA-binding IscR family transcriptional regulator
MRLVEALNGLTDYHKCVSGLSECTDEAPCGMHDSWQTLRRRIIRYLETTTIAELVVSLASKRGVLEKPRRGRRLAAARK